MTYHRALKTSARYLFQLRLFLPISTVLQLSETIRLLHRYRRTGSTLVASPISFKFQHIAALRLVVKLRDRTVSSSMASSSLPGENERKRFLQAANDGDLPLLKRLADELVNLGLKIEKITDVGDKTALHLAAREGHLQVCEYLVEEVKLNIDVRDDYNRTPLHYACAPKEGDIAAYLLQHGANPNAKTIMGRTPLHYAVEEGPMELLELLIGKGAEVDALAECGTPLALAVILHRKDFVKLLLDKDADAGADPNLCSSQATTPLWSAAYKGWIEAIECLLGAGADPNFISNAGTKPIEIAALNGSRQGVTILLPVTLKIPTIPDWSEDGIIKRVCLAEAEADRRQKLEENFLLWKSKGTEAFNRMDYFSAIKWYQEAYYCKEDAAVASNISLCWTRLNEGGRALNAASKCKRLKPDWPKAYYREGAALMSLEQYRIAADVFNEAREMDPTDKEIEHAFRKATKAQNEKLRSEREAIEAQKKKLQLEREAIEVEAKKNGLHSSS